MPREPPVTSTRRPAKLMPRPPRARRAPPRGRSPLPGPRPRRLRLEAGGDPLDGAEDGAAACARQIRALEHEDRRALRGRAPGVEAAGSEPATEVVVERIRAARHQRIGAARA